jgi:oxygen-independent coproporphyrinogen-3 oxidase
VEKGEIAQPDDDEMAVKYELIDDRLSESGFDWYEVSNWAKSGGACRHNLNYWHGGNWWGVGPGAHSHLAGQRWWNIKSPLAYIDVQTKGGSLIAGEEILTDQQRADERIMLGIRLRNGLNLKSMNDAERIVLDGYVKSGAISQEDWDRGAVVLTLSGRMIADRIVRDLVV